MISVSNLPKLKAKVRKHGRYRDLAAATGLSESWIGKFATQPSVNYTLRQLQAINDYFSRKRAA